MFDRSEELQEAIELCKRAGFVVIDHKNLHQVQAQQFYRAGDTMELAARNGFVEHVLSNLGRHLAEHIVRSDVMDFKAIPSKGDSPFGYGTTYRASCFVVHESLCDDFMVEQLRAQASKNKLK